ncbi:MAG: glycosyl hydrolase [Armatimonadota bacterium]
MSDGRPDLLHLLADPPAAYRPAMFWLLNGRLTEDLIREQIGQMADRGCGGFFLHPMGESFRVGDFISGIDPPYLSDEYFDLMRVAVECADEHGIYAWLYDEGGWPSGTAQGKVLEGHEQFRDQVLRVGGDGKIAAEVPVDGRQVLFTVDDTGYRVDHLNPEATARFIEVTHERYAEVLAEYFGGTIPGMFTDETSVRGTVGSDHIPWTDRMLDEFEQRRGFDLRPWLPALFSEDALGFDPAEHFSAEEIVAVRCEFSELWTDLFSESYFEPINDWCAEHDLIHTGHVGGEDALPDHRRGFGHFFKTAGALHAPGVDAIWRQIFPGEENFSFPQFAPSALAHRPWQDPGDSAWRELALSETFAVYGYSLTPEQMRWTADFQFVRGINYICPMALYSDTSEGHWIATMSHLGEGNPLWESFAAFADHCAAMSVAVRESEPVVDVAVYYPIEAAWAGGEALDAAWESLQQVSAALHSRQIAFDFIDARTLCSAEIADGCIATPGQLYGMVVVPDASILPVGVVEALVALREAGGRVALCGDGPEVSADFDASEAFDDARDRLLDGAVTMDRTQASEMGGDDPRGLGMTMTFPLDGFTSAYLGPGGPSQFTEAEVAEGACLLVSEDEVGRLAELLLLVIGRYELQLENPLGELGMSSRTAGDLSVHLLHNESGREIKPRLMLVSEIARAVEWWEPSHGTARVLAVHDEVSEPTHFTVALGPGASALIITRPIGSEPVEVEEQPALLSIGSEVRAQALEVVSEAVITASGDLEIRETSYVPEAVPADFPLRPLEDLGMGDFAGTVAYDIDLYITPGDTERRLFLDLGEVGQVARAWLNGEELGESAWPPHRVEITGLVLPGINELSVEVTTTLANQAARENVVEMARESGWFNAYYERTLSWMRETRSGLIGPVQVLRAYGSSGERNMP